MAVGEPKTKKNCGRAEGKAVPSQKRAEKRDSSRCAGLEYGHLGDVSLFRVLDCQLLVQRLFGKRFFLLLERGSGEEKVKKNENAKGKKEGKEEKLRSVHSYHIC